jgi:hypothetical protein
VGDSSELKLQEGSVEGAGIDRRSALRGAENLAGVIYGSACLGKLLRINGQSHGENLVRTT